ncbi:MAG: hypothetical protein MK161_15615, partial [Pirellulales bacterium]|nr:hypothetical protein [Pirellulales bacterium]
HWALAEAVILSQEAYDGDCAEGCDLTIGEIQAAAESATSCTVNVAQKPNGGWQYERLGKYSTGDMSHMPWALAALLASKKAGLQTALSEQQLGRLKNRFDACGEYPLGDESSGLTVDSQYRYHDGAWSDTAISPRATACALVSRVLLQKLSGSSSHGAIPASHAVVQKFFEDNQPDLEGDLYYNKPGAWLAYMAGNGDWGGSLENYLASTQDLSGGPDDGSWMFEDQYSKGGAPRPNNADGGRLYCTTFAILCLQPAYAGLKILE